MRRGRANGRPDTLRGPGSVPEWTKGAGCKPAAKATLVRIQPGPLKLARATSRRASPAGVRTFRASAASRPRRATGRTCGPPPARCPRSRSRRRRGARSRRRCSPEIRAITEWKPWAAARRSSSSSSRRPMPRPWCESRRYTESSTVRGVGRAGPERRERPEPHDPARRRSATTSAGCPPECSSIHATCSSRVRGTRSKSAVESVDEVVVDGRGCPRRRAVRRAGSPRRRRAGSELRSSPGKVARAPRLLSCPVPPP